jgi:hypothetical protein
MVILNCVMIMIQLTLNKTFFLLSHIHPGPSISESAVFAEENRYRDFDKFTRFQLLEYEDVFFFFL